LRGGASPCPWKACKEGGRKDYMKEGQYERRPVWREDYMKEGLYEGRRKE
jgi:hypothetical protein